MTEPQQPDQRALLKRSLVAIEQLESRLAAVEYARTEPIAIVGIGCRFPGGVDGPAAFWELLRDGVDAVTEVPRERWDADACYDPDPDAVGKSYTRWGGFVDDIEGFDAPFFGISPREAASLDPQQRLLLEVAWEALEHAGIAPSSLAGSRTAVYVGISTHDYSNQLAEEVGMAYADAYASSGSAHSVAAGRLSYFLGLHGPSVAIDTACSSSLVAIHSAVQSLRGREAGVALAGGVNLTLTASGSILTSRARMMSFDGRCKTFDASADGYVRAEGCGMLVLKRLSDAQRDGDRILALIRGSAINQDGRSSGLTAPNGVAQEAVIRDALAAARLAPCDISVIEAHGTGTSLGDPIEVGALGQVFGERDPQRPLLVGSVKTNIGHTEGAAGVAGVIKAVLALQHRTVPASLHFHEPNPLIPWSTLPIRVPTAAAPWESEPGTPRRAGVSSFGFSGTNGHVVLEEAPPIAGESARTDDGRARLLALSAHSPNALREQAARMGAYLQRPDVAGWRDVTFTAGHGRSHLPERLALVAADTAEAAAQLGAFVNGEAAPVALGYAAASDPEVAFLFTGQGSQFVGMARELHATQPAFRSAFGACAAIADPLLERPLASVVMGDESMRELLDDTAFTQPALFAVEYALAQLWRSWGVQPAVVMGHSVGEYVAACVAGVFSLEDGVRLIAHRGRLMSRLPRQGAMAAVFAEEQRVQVALRGAGQRVSVAAVNGPENTVISGCASVVDAVLSRFAAEGVDWQQLNASHAFHSPLMEPMLDEFEAIVATVAFSSPRIGLVSNVTGRMAGDEVATAGYWRRHVRDAVRFSQGIATLHAEGIRTFVEVGPSSTLLRMAQRCAGGEGAAWIPSLRRECGDTESMLQALGHLYVRGQTVDWRAVSGDGARRAELPTYAFQRTRHWHDLTSRSPRGTAGRGSGHPLLGERVASPLHLYQATVAVEAMPWLGDHRIYDLTLFPATGFLELMLAGARDVLGAGDVALEDVTIRERLALPDSGPVLVQVVVTPSADGAHTVEVFSAERDASGMPGEWRRHATARAVRSSDAPPPAKRELNGAPARRQDVESYYTRLAERGAVYGPAFRGIVEMASSGQELLGRVRLPDALNAGAARLQLHPALLDACLQLVGAGLQWDVDRPNDVCVPVGVEHYQVFRAGASEAWCHVALARNDARATILRSDVTLFDDAGLVIARLRGLEFQRVTRTALERRTGAQVRPDWLFEVEWQSAPLPESVADAPAGRWLLLTDGGPLADQLAARLSGRRASVSVARHSDSFAVLPDGWLLDTADPAHYGRLFASHDGRGWAGIVSLLGVDRGGAGADVTTLRDALTARIAAMLAAAPALGEVGAPLWMVTRGAQAVAGSVPDLVQAPAWGLGGVVAAEYPALRAVRVDLDLVARDDEAELLAATLGATDGEDRVALRGGQRYVARLAPGVLASPDAEPPRRLEITERGVLENLALLPAPRAAPGPGQVEIRVVATGLNFRDVLNALGMYPGDPGPLGNECAGVVSAVGEGVHDFVVGDEVVTMVDQCFATHVLAPAALTVHKPANLSFVEAATIPVTFLTAQYAFDQLAHLEAGQRVLVHAATGGVGMAAVQLARRAGAEIFATAGTPAKRELARRLGAHHVSDSRSLAFVDDFAEAAGPGVDVVLNSLAGSFIPASLGMLRTGGHFIEIGKTDIWNADAVSDVYPGVRYHPLYLGEVTEADPSLIRGMLQRLMDDFAAGVLVPLPQTVYPIERAEEAFRFMGQGRHTGKIVITQRHAPEVRADATYLVTGGLGGLGLACARGLAERGARHLVLMGRRAPGDEARRVIEELEGAGVTTIVVAGDVAVESDVAAVLDHIRATLPPLRGVLHAAGVVDDAMLSEQDLARFERVMAPKVQGSWNLHTLTARIPLDFFVMFSSGAALLGSPGQGNYAAANSFMDALAVVRRAQGRHALGINWGSWADVGMASEVGAEHRRRWEEQGLRMIRPAEGVRMLHDALSGTEAANVAILPLDRARLPRTLGRFYQRLAGDTAGTVARDGTPASLGPRLAGASSREHEAIVMDFVGEMVVRVLALERGTRLRTDQSLMDMGLDSLMAMELRNRIQAEARVRVSVADLLAGPTLVELAAMILAGLGDEIGGAEGTLVPAAAPEGGDGWEEGSL